MSKSARSKSKPVGPIKSSKPVRVVIGTFCQDPHGRIAYSYGWIEGRVMVQYDDDRHHPSVPMEDFTSRWIQRPDLQDYPNARDPRLDREFDLQWDIKTRSQLVRRLAEGNSDVEPHAIRDITALMRTHGIVLTAQEQATVEGADADTDAPAWGWQA